MGEFFYLFKLDCWVFVNEKYPKYHFLLLLFDIFSLLAALIGNHVLTTADLAAFHTKLIPDLETDKVTFKLKKRRVLCDFYAYKRLAKVPTSLEPIKPGLKIRISSRYIIHT